MPEKQYPFYRVGIYSNANPKLAPKNCYGLYVEFSGKNNVFLNCSDTIKYLKKAGMIGDGDEILTANIVDMPYAYVIFDQNRQKAVDTINELFKLKRDIYLGR
jgi:hypothetical protein